MGKGTIIKVTALELELTLTLAVAIIKMMALDPGHLIEIDTQDDLVGSGMQFPEPGSEEPVPNVRKNDGSQQFRRDWEPWGCRNHRFLFNWELGLIKVPSIKGTTDLGTIGSHSSIGTGNLGTKSIFLELIGSQIHLR